MNWVHDSYELYTDGYREAANHLCERATSDTRSLDVLIYPIVFLYRQWFELRLKRIIDQGRRLLSEKDGFPKHHRLHHLWPVAKQVLEKVYQQDKYPPEIQLVGQAVADFEKFDAGSQAFRYPIDHDGKNHLEGLEHINVNHLRKQMTSIADLLDGASSGISEYLSHWE